MFVGTLSDTELASKLHPRIGEFFQYIASLDLDSLPLGRHEIDGDEMFVTHALVETPNTPQQPLEAHRRYLDVQILLEGDERIGWKPLERIEEFSTAYDEQADIVFSRESPDFFVNLKPHDFCILFPADGHAPAISEGKIRKLIGKIKV